MLLRHASAGADSACSQVIPKRTTVGIDPRSLLLSTEADYQFPSVECFVYVAFRCKIHLGRSVRAANNCSAQYKPE